MLTQKSSFFLLFISMLIVPFGPITAGEQTERTLPLTIEEFIGRLNIAIATLNGEMEHSKEWEKTRDVPRIQKVEVQKTQHTDEKYIHIQILVGTPQQSNWISSVSDKQSRRVYEFDLIVNKDISKKHRENSVAALIMALENPAMPQWQRLRRLEEIGFNKTYNLKPDETIVSVRNQIKYLLKTSALNNDSVFFFIEAGK